MKYAFTLLLSICGLLLMAQTTTTTTTTHNTRESSYVTNNGKVDSHSSTSNTRSAFEFTADFREYKQDRIESLLFRRLDEADRKKESDGFFWERSYFTCRLTQGTLRLHVDKRAAPANFIAEMEDLGDDLVNIISAHASTTHQGYDPQLWRQRTPVTDKEALKQALRELEAAKLKVERISRKLEKKQ